MGCCLSYYRFLPEQEYRNVWSILATARQSGAPFYQIKNAARIILCIGMTSSSACFDAVLMLTSLVPVSLPWLGQLALNLRGTSVALLAQYISYKTVS